MANRSETLFSAREIRYLQSLPAVANVTPTRISYTKAFRDECMYRYWNGESPVEIFRRAGLDSALIGYKRIERCFARWRKEYSRPDSVDGMESDGRDVSPFDIPERERWSGSGTPPTGDARYDRGREARRDSDARYVYELIMAQQARHISDLERKIRRLEELIEEKSRLREDSSGEDPVDGDSAGGE